MSDYLLEISGDSDLATIELQIRYEEQGPSMFLESHLSFHAGAFTNIVKFRELPASDEPREFKLLLAGSPAPTGFKPVWSGIMLVNRTNEMVVAYRPA